MAHTQRLGLSRDDEQEAADRQTLSLAGLALVLFLVVVSLFVFRQLAAQAALEDCLLANRTNCDLLIGRAR